VPVRTVRSIGKRRSQGRGSRADRAVDVEVAADPCGADAAGQRLGRLLVADELGPVADDLRTVSSPAGCEHVCEVGFRAEGGSAVLVHQADAGRRRGAQCGVDVGAAVGRGDPGVESFPGEVVCLTGHQPAVAPARVVAGAGCGGQSR